MWPKKKNGQQKGFEIFSSNSKAISRDCRQINSLWHSIKKGKQTISFAKRESG